MFLCMRGASMYLFMLQANALFNSTVLRHRLLLRRRLLPWRYATTESSRGTTFVYPNTQSKGQAVSTEPDFPGNIDFIVCPYIQQSHRS